MLGTTYDVFSMGDNENSRSCSLTGKACLSKQKNIINSLESVGMEGTCEFGQPWLVLVNGGKE